MPTRPSSPASEQTHVGEPTGEAASQQACPTPLDWRTVVDEFQAQQTAAVVEINSQSVSACSLGSGSPLIWLHGPAGDENLLALSIWLLREEFQSIVISMDDLMSSAEQADSVSSVATAVATILPREEGSKATLIGVGTSGVVALESAAQSPDAIDRLVLHGAVPGVNWTRMERLMVSLGRKWPGRLRRVPVWMRAATLNHAPWFPPFDPSRWEFLRDNLAETTTTGFAAGMRLAQSSECSERYEHLQTPTMIVQGEGDAPGIVDAQRRLSELMPNCRIEEMHSCGMFPYLTHPHRFVKLIREFLSSPTSDLSLDAGIKKAIR